MKSPSIRVINAQALAAPAGHYSHAVVHLSTIYVSGLLPIDRNGRINAMRPFAQQATLVLDHLEAVLAASGSDLAHVLKITGYVSQIAHWQEFNQIYASRFGDHKPARVVVPVAELHHGFAIEIDAIAALREDDAN